MEVLAGPFPNSDDLLDRVADICPLPAAAQRLMALVHDEQTPIDSIAAAVLCDPALTAQVLRVSNSAAFRHAGAEPVRDLRHALITIGIEELRIMAGAMALLATFATRDELSLDLHRTSAVCGSIVRAIAQPPAGGSRSLPFLCGLLSEVGVLACLAVDGPGYLELWRRVRHVHEGGWSPLVVAERDALETRRYGVTTRTIGGRFLRRHHLPDEIADVIEIPPTQPLGAPLLHRATAFARIVTAIIVEALGRKRAGGLGEQVEEVAKMTCLVEFQTADLVQRCLAAAADMDRTLRATRD